MYQIIKNYRNNDELRKSFNELAGKTFGLNFEDWYQNGFWGENYIPYSIVEDGKVISNVSVNKTDMLLDGEVKHFLQLGTVMTDETYRNQGLSREIMEEIEKDYKDKVDGIYLFASDSVLTFYPKFGFEKSVEYIYSKPVSISGKCQLEQVIMDNPIAWKQLEHVMNNNVYHGKFDMVNNNELVMFYVTKFMQECVYYHSQTGTYVIAEIEGEDAFIHNVFSEKLEELDEVIALLGADVKNVTLGFVPREANEYNRIEYHEEDCTFFIKGEAMQVVLNEKLRIPSLSHA